MGIANEKIGFKGAHIWGKGMWDSYRSESCGQTLNKNSFSSMLHFNFRSMNRASMDFSSGFKNYRRFLLLNLVFGYRATPKLAFDL